MPDHLLKLQKKLQLQMEELEEISEREDFFRAEIAELEDQLTMLANHRSEIQMRLEIYREIIEDLENSEDDDFEDQETETTVSSGLTSNSDSSSPTPQYITPSQQERGPYNMRRLNFVGITAMEAIAQVLSQDPKKQYSLNDVVSEIFETETPEEFQRARASLAAELRRGAAEGRWYKVNRGVYTLSPLNQKTENESQDLFSAEVNGGNGKNGNCVISSSF